MACNDTPLSWWLGGRNLPGGVGRSGEERGGMRQKFEIEGQSRLVNADFSGSPLSLQVGDRVFRVVHRRPGFVLLEDGRCLRYASSGQGERVLQLQGHNYSARIVQARAASGAGSGQGGRVLSPMNGTVVKVQAEVGSRVEAGQVVLVLEAMKMENEVVAPLSGTLARCEASAGQVVQSRQFLFEIQEN